jgi:hypothetical protein
MKTQIDFDYSPGDTVWTFLNEPRPFTLSGLYSIRYAPAKVVQATVRFLQATASSGGTTRSAVLVVNGVPEYNISVDRIFLSEGEAKVALKELLSRPEYSWIKN